MRLRPRSHDLRGPISGLTRRELSSSTTLFLSETSKRLPSSSSPILNFSRSEKIFYKRDIKLAEELLEYALAWPSAIKIFQPKCFYGVLRFVPCLPSTCCYQRRKITSALTLLMLQSIFRLLYSCSIFKFF